MAKTVKMSDMTSSVAVRVFQLLNPGEVTIAMNDSYEEAIVTDTEPKHLVYPEGWYYAKGCFRNKHMSSTGAYSEVEMETSDGRDWRDLATYCTLEDN